MRFVVVSGLPGSGKSTLARRLSPLLGRPVVDKDDDLEALFDARGVGDRARRRELSRESDERFRARALAAPGGLLVSFWNLAGMPADSGTPSEWLAALPGPAIQLWCRCPVEEAARRFLERSRHPGHLDAERERDELIEQLTRLRGLEPLVHGRVIEVDTGGEPDARAVAERIRRAAAGASDGVA